MFYLFHLLETPCIPWLETPSSRLQSQRHSISQNVLSWSHLLSPPSTFKDPHCLLNHSIPLVQGRGPLILIPKHPCSRYRKWAGVGSENQSLGLGTVWPLPLNNTGLLLSWPHPPAPGLCSSSFLSMTQSTPLPPCHCPLPLFLPHFFFLHNA